MAAGPGRNAFLEYADTTISTYLSVASEAETAGTGETTAFGDSWREYITTLKEAGLDLTGNWDATIDGILSLGTETTYEYGPMGNTAGYVKLSGSCILDTYNITPALDGRLEFSGHLRVTGTVARGTF